MRTNIVMMWTFFMHGRRRSGPAFGLLKKIYHYHIWKVEPDPHRIIRDYLYYFFKWDNELIKKEQGAGATMIHVSKGSMEARKIPLPTLEEQKRIVAVLDQAFAALDRARANAEANLAASTALFDTELRDVFTKLGSEVEKVPFDALCTAITPKTKIQRKDYLPNGLYPIVSQEADLVSEYWNDASSLMGINEPVVIFGDHTRCLKYVDFDFVVGADGTKVLRAKKGVSAELLYYGLRSMPVEGTGYARHFKFIREAKLTRLALEDQEDLVHRLSKIEGKCRVLRTGYELKLASIAALRQVFLRKAFSGQLTT